jgi:hypothetical protein
MQSYRLPPVSKEFLEILDKAFEHPDVVPGVDRDTLMFRAGCRHVVDWIKKQTSVSNIPNPVQQQLAEVRYGSASH